MSNVLSKDKYPMYSPEDLKTMNYYCNLKYRNISSDTQKWRRDKFLESKLQMMVINKALEMKDRKIKRNENKMKYVKRKLNVKHLISPYKKKRRLCLKKK